MAFVILKAQKVTKLDYKLEPQIGWLDQTQIFQSSDN